MTRLNKTESPIFPLLCVLCFQGSLLYFYLNLTAAGNKCRVVAVKRLPVLHHSADNEGESIKKQPNLFLGEIDLFFFDVIAL